MRDVVDVVARLAADRWGDGVARTPGRGVAARHRRPRPVGVHARRGRRRAGRRWRPARAADARRSQRGRRDARAVDRDPQARVAAAEGRARTEVLRRCARRSASSASSPCARRPAARTCRECWADGTATFMVLGERCTRACGFCLVDTRKPLDRRRRRTRAGRRGGRPDGARPRRAHDGGPRRPRRRRDGARRRVRRGDPSAPARRTGRDADLRRQGRRRVARRCCSQRGPTC